MGNLNRSGYMELINSDIKALEKSNITRLEKDHIISVLRWSADMLYFNEKRLKRLIDVLKTLEGMSGTLDEHFNRDCEDAGAFARKLAETKTF